MTAIIVSIIGLVLGIVVFVWLKLRPPKPPVPKPDLPPIIVPNEPEVEVRDIRKYLDRKDTL